MTVFVNRTTKKSLGQHFLVDRHYQRTIVEALEATPETELLEIGPGRGALTDHLVGRVGRLVLVELDHDLAAMLAERYGARDDVEVVNRDILELPLDEISDDPGRLVVVGNIPYNITTPIVFHLLERPRPARIVVMVQREVGDRILAEPGGGDYGALSLGVRTVARCERMTNVPRGAFRPMPKVDSTVLRIDPIEPPPLTEGEEARLRTLVRALFQWRRKQIQKTLRDHPDLGWSRETVARRLGELGIAPTARPETLGPPTLVALASEAGAEAGEGEG